MYEHTWNHCFHLTFGTDKQNKKEDFWYWSFVFFSGDFKWWSIWIFCMFFSSTYVFLQVDWICHDFNSIFSVILLFLWLSLFCFFLFWVYAIRFPCFDHCHSNSIDFLGHSKYGIYVCKHADVCIRHASVRRTWEGNVVIKMIVFKVGWVVRAQRKFYLLCSI